MAPILLSPHAVQQCLIVIVAQNPVSQMMSKLPFHLSGVVLIGSRIALRPGRPQRQCRPQQLLQFPAELAGAPRLSLLDIRGIA